MGGGPVTRYLGPLARLTFTGYVTFYDNSCLLSRIPLANLGYVIDCVLANEGYTLWIRYRLCIGESGICFRLGVGEFGYALDYVLANLGYVIDYV